MALEDFYEPFNLQDWRNVPDGFGGAKWEWSDGIEFMAGIIFDGSTEARIAEAQGVKNRFTIMTSPTMNIEFEDVIRRVKNGAYYRITGDPVEDMPPEQANTQFKRVSAEKVDRP